MRMNRGALLVFFFFQAEDGIRDKLVTGVQTCALPIYHRQPVRHGSMRRGPSHGAVDACWRAARAYPPDAGPDSGVQRVSLGGTHVDRRRRHEAPRAVVTACGDAGAAGGGTPSQRVPGRARQMTRSPPAPRPHWAYFLDIDGTLVDLSNSPIGASLDADGRHLIDALYRAAGGAVALISGRSITDTDRLAPDLRLPAAGQHGIERRNAVGRISRHEFPAQGLEWVRRELAAAVESHHGLALEDKGLSLALHYRRAPRLGGFVHRLVRSLATRLGPQYCVPTGKRIVEMKPAGKNKGVAVQEFMQEEPFRGRTPVFVGDDSTDEYGFAMVNRLHGHSIKVGPGRTAARWRLRDVRAVHAWLVGP